MTRFAVIEAAEPRQIVENAWASAKTKGNYADFTREIADSLGSLRNLLLNGSPDAANQINRMTAVLGYARNAILSQKNLGDAKAEIGQAFFGEMAAASKAPASGFWTQELENDKEFKKYLQSNPKLNQDMVDVMSRLELLKERMDYASANALKNSFDTFKHHVDENTPQGEKALKSLADIAKDYLHNSMPALPYEKYKDKSGVDLFTYLPEEFKAAEDSLSYLRNWLAWPDRKAKEIKKLSDALLNGDAAAVAKLGLPPKLVSSQIAGALFLRSYAASSAEEFYQSIPSQLRKKGEEIIKLPAKPENATQVQEFSGALDIISQCQGFLEQSGILEGYRKRAELFNPKFDNLDIMGKFFFLTSSLDEVLKSSQDRTGAINVLLSDGMRLTGAGQIGYFGKAMPQILQMYYATDTIGQLSNGIAGTAIIYGQLDDYAALGQKQYMGEVSERIALARNDYLSQLQEDMVFNNGREEEIKLKPLGENFYERIRRDRITPQDLNMSVFSNVVLEAYLLATGNTEQRGLGQQVPFGDPKPVIDRFFQRGLPEMLPWMPEPRAREWYGPSIDSLMRELTRVDLLKHRPTLFSQFIADAFGEQDKWDGTTTKSLTEVQAQVFGPRGSAQLYEQQDWEREKGHLTLAGNDLSNGENWTVKNINADWDSGLGNTRLNAQLDAYAGKDANLLLFVNNDYDAGTYSVRSYIRKGNVWARFFSDERLTTKKVEQKYGRIISPYEDVRASFQQGNLAGAVVGINMKSIGLDAGVVAAAATPRGVFGKAIETKKDDLGAGAYFFLPSSASLDAENPLVFAQYAKVSGMGAGGAKYISKSLFADLAVGKEQFAIEAALKQKKYFVSASYMNMMRLAYQGTNYSFWNAPATGNMSSDGSFVPQERIKGGGFETQYDWGSRSSAFLIANTIAHQFPDSEKIMGNERDSNLIAALKLRDEKGDGFRLQGSYHYSPYSYSSNVLQYLRSEYDRIFPSGIGSSSSVEGARSQTLAQRNELLDIANRFTPMTGMLMQNMLKTAKFEYDKEQTRILVEAAGGPEQQLGNLGFQFGRWSIGGSFARTDFSKLVGLSLSKQFGEGGMARLTLAVPVDQGRGFNLNAGLLEGPLPKGFSLIGSYTSLDFAAGNIASQFNTELQNASQSDISLRGGGIGAHYMPSPDTKYYMIFTQNERTGKTNVRITDNTKEAVNTQSLIGLTGGLTVYSFSESGLINSWTVGAFAERVTLDQLEKEKDKVVSKLFKANRYGGIVGHEEPFGSVSGQLGLEYYGTPTGEGKGLFGKLNVRIYF